MSRFRASRRLIALLTLAVVAGCGGGPGRQDDASGSGAEPAPAPPDDDTPAGAQQPVCLRSDGFIADGRVQVRGSPGGQPTRVDALRWERHDGCERFVLDLAGDPSPPAADVELLRERGLVRIRVPGAREVARDAADARFDGPLARAAYAIWAPGGEETWIDLHLGEAAEASAALLAEPARVVVDLRAGGGRLPPPPARGPRVVVLEPRGGEASYPLRVVGYARTFEANVVGRLEQEGREVAETFTTATAWADAWGYFELTLEEGPSGPVELHVGEHSARDGTWEGVSVALVMR